MLKELFVSLVNTLFDFITVLVVLALMTSENAGDISSHPNFPWIIFAYILIASAVVALINVLISRTMSWVGEKLWT